MVAYEDRVCDVSTVITTAWGSSACIVGVPKTLLLPTHRPCTVEDCCNACMNTVDCTQVSYQKDDGGCLLHNGCPDSTVNPEFLVLGTMRALCIWPITINAMITAHSPPPKHCGMITFDNFACDVSTVIHTVYATSMCGRRAKFFGKKHLHYLSVDDCCYKCTQTQDCTHVSYKPADYGCMLHNGCEVDANPDYLVLGTLLHADPKSSQTVVWHRAKKHHVGDIHRDAPALISLLLLGLPAGFVVSYWC